MKVLKSIRFVNTFFLKKFMDPLEVPIDHKSLRNLHRRFDWHYIEQIYSGDFATLCCLLRIYELYNKQTSWIVHIPRSRDFLLFNLMGRHI